MRERDHEAPSAPDGGRLLEVVARHGPCAVAPIRGHGILVEEWRTNVLECARMLVRPKIGALTLGVFLCGLNVQCLAKMK